MAGSIGQILNRLPDCLLDKALHFFSVIDCVHCLACSGCVVSIKQMYSNIQMIATLAIVKDCKKGRSKQAYKGMLCKRSKQAKSPHKPI